MKNPLKYLKHVIKDPITNIEEADVRKKELMPLLYTSVGLVVVGVVAGLLLEFLMVIAGIGALGLLLCLFLFFIIKKAKEKFAALTCDGCKEMMEIKTEEDYKKYVTYSLSGFSHEIKYSQVSNSEKTGIIKISAYGSSSVCVDYICTCPKCGTKNGIKYRITPFNTTMEEEYKPALVRAEQIEAETETKVLSTFRALVAHSAEIGSNPVELDTKKVTAKKMIGSDTISFSLSDHDVEELKEATAIELPVTSHSIHHPDYGKASIASASCPAGGKFRSVGLKYHRTVEEMAEGFFVRNELNGEISKA